jgi:hypothetical protein
MKFDLMQKMDALVPDGLSIILLEGTRKVPAGDAPALRAFASELAGRHGPQGPGENGVYYTSRPIRVARHATRAIYGARHYRKAD